MIGRDHQHFAFESKVKGWAATLGVIRVGHGAGEIGAEQSEINDPAEPLKRYFWPCRSSATFGREVLKRLSKLKSLFSPTSPGRTIADDHHTMNRLPCEFLEVSSCAIRDYKQLPV